MPSWLATSSPKIGPMEGRTERKKGGRGRERRERGERKKGVGGGVKRRQGKRRREERKDG